MNYEPDAHSVDNDWFVGRALQVQQRKLRESKHPFMKSLSRGVFQTRRFSTFKSNSSMSGKQGGALLDSSFDREALATYETLNTMFTPSSATRCRSFRLYKNGKIADVRLT